ncbi:MAG: hypothetical protein PHV30_04435 [Candidatus Margulisbacteria bacterium]|nr:hypothetical protein [Candidatus Margulisiibacteriota bacterium]
MPKKESVPLEFRQVVFKDKTREELLAQINTASLVSGYVELPADMQLKFPAVDIRQGNYKTMQQNGSRLILRYAGKAELEKLAERENKIAEYRSQLSEIDLKIQTITLCMKEHEFFYTGEVKVRE